MILKKTLVYFAIIFLHFFLIRVGLLILYYNYFSSLTAWQILSAFFEGLRFDFSSMAVFFSIPLLVINLPFRFFRKKSWFLFWSWITYLLLIIVTFFLVADLIYFDFVKRHITYEFLMLSDEDFYTIFKMSFGVFLPYLIILFLIYLEVFILWKRITKNFVAKNYLLIPKFIFIFLILFVLGRGGFGMKPVTIIDAFASGDTKYSNLVINGIFSLSHSSLRSENVSHKFLDSKKAHEVVFANQVITNAEYPLQKTYLNRKASNYNLVLILIESLSFKYVDAFANLNLGVTPNLDSISAEGLKFTHFFANGQRSVEGIQASLTGIPSIIGMPTIGIGLMTNYPKLGKIAQKNGYSTIFVQALKRRSFRMDAVAGSLGFADYYGMEDMPLILDYPDPTGSKFGWDYETLMFALQKFEKLNKPFFATILTSTTHTPYARLPVHLEKYPPSAYKEEGLLNTINYTDWSIGEFLKQAKNFSWFENTVFIITTDHALAQYSLEGEQQFEFINKFHIPLIIYAPKIYESKIIDSVGSQLDLFPTMIDILQFNGQFSALGNSLLTPHQDNYAIAREGSVMGIIDNQGYLRHSLKNRLETGSFIKETDKDYFDQLETRLLATDQVSYELMQTNKWSEE